MNYLGIKKILLTLFLGYFSLVGFLYTRQESMIYFPDSKDFYNCQSYEDQEMKEYKNTRFYQRQGKKDGVIIFFHGNAGRACERVVIQRLLEKTNYTIIFVEYSGYAQGPEIQPGIQDILQNVDDIGEYVESKNYDQVFIMGRSLGTGPASYYAGKFQTDKLILISPYSQLYKIAAAKYPVFPIKYLFSQNYKPEKYLTNYNSEILFVHGKLDTVIPYKFGIELYDSLKYTDKFFLDLPTGTHHNIFEYNIVNEGILEFLNKKEK